MRTLRPRWPWYAAVVALAAITACNSNSDNGSTNTGPTPSIGIALSSATATAVQGQSASPVTVTLTRNGGFSGAVDLSLEGAPSGVTGTFSPTQIASGATSSTLTLSAASSAAAGTSNLTVRARGSGVSDQTATVGFTVTAAPQGAFSIALSPTTFSLQQGQSTTITANITRTNGFTGAVNLSLGTLPTGVTATIAGGAPPQSITGNSAAIVLTAASNAATGAFTLTVNGTGTGVANQSATASGTVTAAPASSVALTVNPTSLTVQQGQSGSAAITIARTNFTGAVALTASVANSPAGITATVAPASATADTSRVTVAVAATAAPGTYQVTLRGTGTGITDQTATLTLTVTAAPSGSVSLSVSPTTFTLQRGGTATLTLTINRTNFTGPVDVTLRNLPAGVTATVNGTSAFVGALGARGSRSASRSSALVPVTGTTATIVLTASSTAALGNATITIAANATGLTEATVTATATITAAPSGNIAFTFCDATNLPVWFAYQDGSGPWTTVTGSNNAYRFDVSSSTAGVAWVTNQASGPIVFVYYVAASELPAFGSGQCVNNSPTLKNVTVAFAGLNTGDLASVGIGGASGTSVNGGPVSLNITQGARDLVAVRQRVNSSTVSFTADKVVIARQLNLAVGSTYTADFNSSQAVAPAQANVTVANINGESATVSSFFQTADGVFVSFGFASTTGAAQPFFGVPTAQLATGDIHAIQAVASSGSTGSSSSRVTQLYFRTVADRTITLGSPIATNSCTVASTTPFPLLRFQATVQSEYDKYSSASFSQAGTGNNAAWIVSRTAASRGSATTWDETMPNLSTASGWNAAWQLKTGVQTTCSGTVMGWNSSGVFAPNTDGTILSYAQRLVTITP